MSLHPKIYVACLASAQAGIRHGVWLKADGSEDDIQEEIADMLAHSTIPQATEWNIQGTVGFEEIDIRGASLRKIGEIAGFLHSYGELGAEILRTVCDGDVDRAHQLMESCYQGAYGSVEAFAQDLMEACWDIPDSLAPYLDYEAFANDLMIDDYFTITLHHTVHVFHQD